MTSHLCSTLYSGDDEEHKSILGVELSLIKQESHFNNSFEPLSTSTLGGLPNLDPFSDLDFENEVTTNLARLSPSENIIYRGNKRQRLDLTLFDEEEFLSDDRFEDLDDVDRFTSVKLPTPQEPCRALENSSSKMKTVKKHSPPKVLAKKNADMSDSVPSVKHKEHSHASSSAAKQDASAEETLSIPDSTAAASGCNTVFLSTDTAATSVQPVARRGRKQFLTDDPSETFVCTCCSRSFRRKAHLIRHYRSLHTHDKPFKCDECSKKFSRSDNLSMHASIHENGVLEYGKLPPTETGSPIDHQDAAVQPKKAVKPHIANTLSKDPLQNDFPTSPGHLLTQATALPEEKPSKFLREGSVNAAAINYGLSRSSKEPGQRQLYAYLDPLYNQPMQSSFSSPQPLHPLVTMPQWPSQITNPTENSPPTVMPLHRPILPLSKTTDAVPKLTPSPAPEKKKPAHSTSTSRRTLTDSDRRRMCEYHSDNPKLKQTEIGGECKASTV